jgi:DNA-binding XRE family transcriptional regulator
VPRLRKYWDLEEFENKIDEYFINCDKAVRDIYDKKGSYVKTIYKPYTVTGLCVHLDICRQTLSEMEKEDKYSDTIKRAKVKIEAWQVEHSMNRDIDNTTTIFSLKNNFGWKDKQEIESINKNENINVDLNHMSDEELKEIVKDLFKDDK